MLDTASDVVRGVVYDRVVFVDPTLETMKVWPSVGALVGNKNAVDVVPFGV